ncbi:hypothetical protein GCM10009851_21620 [Herbiconiux moechotypicola]|uniref:HTH tetR-type domain-containing protein n=2 Tax=Herbiconiux moechotypicola TaxID=637393 RepID=A0ABN3DMT3_9MICO
MPVAERRAQLLHAAFVVIARSGVGGATTRAVVDEAGMKLASFHYAFTSREELLSELVEDVLHGQETLLDLPALDALDGPDDLETLLAVGLLGYFEGVRADPLRERAMFELTQYAMRTPGLEPLAARQYERYRALARAALEEAARRAGRRWSRPVDEIAGHLVALTDGATLAWLADPDDTRARATLTFAARSLAALAAPYSPSTPAALPDASATFTSAALPSAAPPTRSGSTEQRSRA